MIYTIGYGQNTFEEFVARLRSYGVTHLGDVRSIPYSNYQAEFRGETLGELCKSHGLKYVYLGDRLGAFPPTEASANLSREEHRALPLFREAIDRIIASSERMTLCLMCGCSRPEVCHRSTLLAEELDDRGVPVTHILADGTSVDHREIQSQLRPEQFSLEL
ncbi:MAG: DUF488 domain-containing protein [Armatimonadetes bacterium]|nr:DUF488 domain-containing protein [Armatimonadota bacterium]